MAGKKILIVEDEEDVIYMVKGEIVRHQTEDYGLLQ